MDEESGVLCENGVKINVMEDHDNPKKCHTFFNPKMKICREYVLTTLKSFSKEVKWSSDTEKLKCLDAFGATGVAGLQWVMHCGDKVDVTINELSEDVVKQIKHNCSINAISPDHSSRDVNGFATKEVEITNMDANIILHSRQFNFIHIDPFGTTVQFLDSTFRNVYNDGIVILTSTDVGALYGKCPNVLRRNYGAVNISSDYKKEMAARIVLAAATQSAARCNKGLKVLYCLAVEHFVQVAVRIKRGAQKADISCSMIRRIMHCQICGEWSTLPRDRYDLDLHSIMICKCHESTPGTNAIELGPLWVGDIFDSAFIQEMLVSSKEITGSFGSKCITLLEAMLEESKCTLSSTKSSECSNNTKGDDESLKTSTESGECAVTQTSPVLSRKTSNASCLSRRKYGPNEIPMFYYNLHKRKVGQFSLPRYHKIIAALRLRGFSASRTHLDPQSIRTSATISELKDIIHSMCSENNDVA